MTTGGPSNSSGPDELADTVPVRPVNERPVNERPVNERPAAARPAPAEVSIPDPLVPPSPPVHPTRGPNEIALGVVLLAVVVGLALVGQDHWRRGLLLIGIGLIAGSGLRLVLPARVVGLLAVRGRVFDAVVLGLLGLAVIVLTSSVPLPPGSG